MDKDALKQSLGWDRCTECGRCLSECRYLSLSEEEAIREIRKINAGLPSRVVEGCKSCYACNTFCPNAAHPYERIICNWNERYEARGLPARASYLLPGRRPNFRQDLPFREDERALHVRWAAERPPADTVLYPGCNLLAAPRLAEGRIFELLPVWGSWEVCCGEPFFRMGLFDHVRTIASRLTDFYQARSPGTMVFICPAGYNMFTNVLPEQFGAQFPFATRFFTDWFLEALEQGTLEITHPLNRRIVVHDSCHARILGPDFMEKQRALLQRLGLEVVDPPIAGSRGLCCGVAAGCSHYSAFDIVKEGSRALEALADTEAENILAYCTGCWLTLNSILALSHPFGKRVVHMLQLVREALGESVPSDVGPRPFSMLSGIAWHGLLRYLDPRRFRLEDGP